MAAGSPQKRKLLELARILMQQTDEEHGLSMPQILQSLDNVGISAERKSIYRDLDTLREFGLDVQTLGTSPVQYALANRDFELSELMLIVDALQSSRFLSERKSRDLVAKVRNLASLPQRTQLNKEVHVHGRPDTQARSDFNTVDRIQEAIATRHKISFHYFRYNVLKDKIDRKGGEAYVATPVCLVYNDGNYYLVAYSDKHDAFANYRVDRMERVIVLADAATRNKKIAEFNPDELGSCAFGMYNGERELVELKVDTAAMNVVIDRFGPNVDCKAISDKEALITAPVIVSPVFFGWLAQMGTQVRIMKPTALAGRYADFLREIMDAYPSAK